MSRSTDDQGRIQLPKSVRERFGEEYRIIELPGRVALFPVDDDPIDGVRAVVGDAFEGDDANKLKDEARESIRNQYDRE